jgi:hypothetical protein
MSSGLSQLFVVDASNLEAFDLPECGEGVLPAIPHEYSVCYYITVLNFCVFLRFAPVKIPKQIVPQIGIHLTIAH